LLRSHRYVWLSKYWRWCIVLDILNLSVFRRLFRSRKLICLLQLFRCLLNYLLKILNRLIHLKILLRLLLLLKLIIWHLNILVLNFTKRYLVKGLWLGQSLTIRILLVTHLNAIHLSLIDLKFILLFKSKFLISTKLIPSFFNQILNLSSTHCWVFLF
jgi:hypothetical protein